MAVNSSEILDFDFGYLGVPDVRVVGQNSIQTDILDFEYGYLGVPNISYYETGAEPEPAVVEQNVIFFGCNF